MRGAREEPIARLIVHVGSPAPEALVELDHAVTVGRGAVRVGDGGVDVKIRREPGAARGRWGGGAVGAVCASDVVGAGWAWRTCNGWARTSR